MGFDCERTSAARTSAFLAAGDCLSPACMTTAEQMFFHGAPLAHVLRYEDELRSDRDRRTRDFEWARRVYA